MKHRLSCLPWLLLACAPEGVLGGAALPLEGANPTDFRGRYLVSIVADEDGCLLFGSPGAAGVGGAGTPPGTNNTDVSVVIDQLDDRVTVTVESWAGALIGLAHGTNVYQGRVDGNRFTATITGTIPGGTTGCSWFLDNQLEATLDGDLLTGSTTYIKARQLPLNCSDCSSVQRFNGTRPPRSVVPAGVDGSPSE